MKKIFILLATIILSTSVVYAQDTSKLVYMTEDYPPYNFKKDGEVRGISADLLRLMWKKMDYEEQDIDMLPWARGYKLTLKKENHVLMSMTRIPQREALFKWVGPLASSTYVLIKLSSNNITPATLEDAKKFKIGNIRGDATDQILTTSGFDAKHIVKINKIEQAIKMLKTKRIDFIAYEKESFFKTLKEKNYLVSDFKSTIILSEVEDYYAFNKKTSDVVIQKFQYALDSLEKEHKEILEYYLNTP